MIKTAVTAAITLLLISPIFAQYATPDWSDNDDFFNSSTTSGTDTTKNEEDRRDRKKEEMRAEKAPEVKDEKKSERDMQIGVAGLGGFSVGSGMADLNLNYSAMLLFNQRLEFYAVGGHTLGFDSFRKFRLGAGYYFLDPEAFRVGASFEVGPAFMEKKGGDTEEKTNGFAWIGGRATAGYRFLNDFFLDGYAVLGIAPKMINEAGVRVGYYF